MKQLGIHIIHNYHDIPTKQYEELLIQTQTLQQQQQQQNKSSSTSTSSSTTIPIDTKI